MISSVPVTPARNMAPPPVPSGMAAAFAIVCPGMKLRVETSTLGPSVGRMRRKPGPGGLTAVTLAETASAAAGMPQRLVSTKLRGLPAGRAGGP